MIEIEITIRCRDNIIKKEEKLPEIIFEKDGFSSIDLLCITLEDMKNEIIANFLAAYSKHSTESDAGSGKCNNFPKK